MSANIPSPVSIAEAYAERDWSDAYAAVSTELLQQFEKWLPTWLSDAFGDAIERVDYAGEIAPDIDRDALMDEAQVERELLAWLQKRAGK